MRRLNKQEKQEIIDLERQALVEAGDLSFEEREEYIDIIMQELEFWTLKQYQLYMGRNN